MLQNYDTAVATTLYFDYQFLLNQPNCVELLHMRLDFPKQILWTLLEWDFLQTRSVNINYALATPANCINHAPATLGLGLVCS